MAAKIVVRIQYQNSRFLATTLPIEIGRRESTDPSTNNDQIVLLGLILNCAKRLPGFSIPQLVREVEDPVLVSSQAVQRRRIHRPPSTLVRTQQPLFAAAGDGHAADRQCDAIQKIAPGD